MLFGLRGAGRVERAIEGHPVPDELRRELESVLRGADWAIVERSLRDWWICLAHGRGRKLGVPSRVVQWLSGRLIDLPAAAGLPAAREVREAASNPEEPSWPSLVETVRAWDRSRAGRERDTPLWSLDEQLQLDNPIGIGHEALTGLRSEEDRRYGGPFAYGGGGNGGF